jgi:hypothetical protein
VSEDILIFSVIVKIIEEEKKNNSNYFVRCRIPELEDSLREMSVNSSDNDLIRKIRSLKFELEAAVSGLKFSNMEKEEPESTLQAALKQIQSLNTEMEKAVSREKTAHLEKARMESALQTAMEQIQSVDTELKATVSRHETSHEEATMESELQTAMKTEMKAAETRQKTSHVEERQNITKTASSSEDSVNSSTETTIDFSKIQNMDAHLDKALEKVHQLEMLLSERENIITDLKKELAQYQTQKNDNAFKKHSVTNGLESQSLAPGQQAENDLLQKDLVIRNLEKQIDVQRQRARDDGNRDAVIIEKQACKIRMLTSLLQTRNRREKADTRTAWGTSAGNF